MITISQDGILFNNERLADTPIRNQSLHIVKTDKDGRFTYLNPLFCESSGILEADYIGKLYQELVLPEDHEAFHKTFGHCLAAAEEVQQVLLRKQTAAGIVSTQWEFIRLNDHQGQFREVLCIGHDVTRLVRKQENLQNIVAITSRQNERLLDFTYIVSHNIRSHVANLSGIINGIDRDDPADMDYSLELLKISVGALDSTIHHLNEIVSIQAATDLPLQPLNLYEEAAKTLHLLQQQIRDTNAEIIVDLSMEQMLLTNPAYLESILLNLLSNALKYRQPDCLPVVRITFQQEPKFGVLRISDNGLGIDLTRNGEKLFKLFGTFHDHKDARGVGLFIVKTQVEALGGKILVESEPGKGSIFSVYFKNSA